MQDSNFQLIMLSVGTYTPHTNNPLKIKEILIYEKIYRVYRYISINISELNPSHIKKVKYTNKRYL